MFYKQPHNGNFAFFERRPAGSEALALPGGSYEYIEAEMFTPPQFVPIDLATHAEVELSTIGYRRVRTAVEKFFAPTTRERAQRYNVAHRMGILLHGPHGTGKSTLIRQILRDVATSHGAVALICDPDEVMDAITLVRKDDPERPMIVVWEEFDTWAEPREGYVKAIMDGLNSPENLLFLATTNYLERIPESLANRPGRFAYVTKIGYFTESERRDYVGKLLDAMHVPASEREALDVDAVITQSEGRSADEIKHVLLNTLLYGLTMDDTLAQLAEVSNDQQERQRQHNTRRRARKPMTDPFGKAN